MPAFARAPYAGHGTVSLDLEDSTSYRCSGRCQRAGLAPRTSVRRNGDVRGSTPARSLSRSSDGQAPRSRSTTWKRSFELHVGHLAAGRHPEHQDPKRGVGRHFPNTFTAMHFGNRTLASRVPRVSKPDMCRKIGCRADRRLARLRDAVCDRRAARLLVWRIPAGTGRRARSMSVSPASPAGGLWHSSSHRPRAASSRRHRRFGQGRGVTADSMIAEV